jgi:AraC-like DNA-binding protein
VSSGLELTIERGADLASQRRAHEEPALILCLATSIVELSRDRDVVLLDRSNVALVPARAPYRLKKKSSTIAVLTLRIGPLARRFACEDYAPNVNATELASYLEEGTLLLRTRWLDEIAQRYLFERDVCEKPQSHAARFLESELTKEIFFLVKERRDEKVRRSLVSDQTALVQRALAMLEQDLFSPLRVSALARACHASESTLLRAFKKEVGTAPAAYQRERRLDESVLLLRGRQLGVAEVAMRVGYTNVPAFTTAFRRRFGAPPSALLGDEPPGIPLPPEGYVERPQKAAGAAPRRRKRRRG